MPSNAQLLKSIFQNDLAGLRNILAACDPQGIPYADINRGTDQMHNALLYALSLKPVSLDICLELLRVRDIQGRVVINLNKRGNFLSLTALEAVVQARGLTAEEKHRLFDQILNLRNPMGERVCQLADLKDSILFLAVDSHDLNLVRAALDLRYDDGSFVVDVNTLRYSETALGWAMVAPEGKEVDENLIKVLRQEGCLTAEELVRMDEQARIKQRKSRPMNPQPDINFPILTPEEEKRERKEPQQAIIRRAPVRKPQSAREEIKNFENNRQNTHDHHVVESMALSLFRLEKRYPNLNIQETLLDFLAYLKKLPANNKRRDALACYDRVQGLIEKHARTGFTLAKILALVWEGVNDKNAPVQGSQGPATDDIIKIRREALIEKLVASQNEYSEGPPASCTGGTANLIVDALNKAHPDVDIVRGSYGIPGPAAEYAHAIMLIGLQKKPDEEQRRILGTWDLIADQEEAAENKEEKGGREYKEEKKYEDEEKIELKNNHHSLISLGNIYEEKKKGDQPAAVVFHQIMKPQINKALKERFGDLITKEMFEEITGDASYRYFPWPCDKKFKDLIKKITEPDADEEKNDTIKYFFKKLKRQASEIFKEGNRTLEEGWQWLSREYYFYESIVTLIQNQHMIEQDASPIVVHFKQKLTASLAQLNTEKTFEQNYLLLEEVHQDYLFYAELQDLQNKIALIQNEDKRIDESVVTRVQQVRNRVFNSSLSFKEGCAQLEKAHDEYQSFIFKEPLGSLNAIIQQIQNLNIHYENDAEKKAALNLHAKLQQAIDNARQGGGKIQEKMKLLSDQAKQALIEAKPILCQYSQWKEIIVNALLVVSILGLLALGVKAYLTYKNTGQCSFFYAKTPIEKTWERANSCVARFTV